MGAPAVGTVENGYRFNGGDPGNQASWSPVTDAGGLEILGDGYKRSPLGTVFRQGPQGGLTRVRGPNDTQSGEAVKSAAGANAALQSIDRIDSQFAKVKTAGPLGQVLDPVDLAVLQQSTTDLMMRMKGVPYELGVITGPDMALMNQIIKDPGSVDAMVFRQKVKPLLSNLSTIMGEQYRRDRGSFESLGGTGDGLPPLYRSPRSKYTPEEFGRQGIVPPAAMARPGKPPAVPRIAPVPAMRKQQALKADGKLDLGKPRGSQNNPYIARDQATANRLPKGSYVIMPDGSLGIVE
jgi:hypothetical protein